MFTRALPLALISALVAQPAHAGPFGTYGMSDSNTTGTWTQGRLGIDLRAIFSTPGDALAFPSLALIYGLTDRVEIGIASALVSSGLGTGTSATNANAVLPWVKARFNDGPLTFGVLAGGITPVRGGVSGTFGADLLVTWKPEPLTIDLNVGLGRLYNPGDTLLHTDLAVWIPAFPGGTFYTEFFALHAFAAGATVNQQAGLVYAFSERITGDVCLGVSKTLATPGLTWTPQVGVTFTI